MGKIPLGRPNCKWEDSIGIDFKEVDVITRNEIDVALYRDCWRALVNASLNLHVA